MKYLKAFLFLMLLLAAHVFSNHLSADPNVPMDWGGPAKSVTVVKAQPSEIDWGNTGRESLVIATTECCKDVKQTVKKVCPCSPACACGCNEGAPCECRTYRPGTTYQTQPTYYQPVYYQPAPVYAPAANYGGGCRS